MDIEQIRAQLRFAPQAATLAEAMTLEEALAIVLPELPALPDPSLVTLVSAAKGDAVLRKQAARLLLHLHAKTPPT